MDYSLYRAINGLSGYSPLDHVARVLANDLSAVLIAVVAALFLIPWPRARCERRCGAVAATAAAAIALLINQPITNRGARAALHRSPRPRPSPGCALARSIVSQRPCNRGVCDRDRRVPLRPLGRDCSIRLGSAPGLRQGLRRHALSGRRRRRGSHRCRRRAAPLSPCAAARHGEHQPALFRAVGATPEDGEGSLLSGRPARAV